MSSVNVAHVGLNSVQLLSQRDRDLLHNHLVCLWKEVGLSDLKREALRDPDLLEI